MRAIRPLLVLGLGTALLLGGIQHSANPTAYAHPAAVHATAPVTTVQYAGATTPATLAPQDGETADGSDVGPNVQQGDQSAPDTQAATSDAVDSADGELTGGPDGDTIQLQQ